MNSRRYQVQHTVPCPCVQIQYKLNQINKNCDSCKICKDQQNNMHNKQCWANSLESEDNFLWKENNINKDYKFQIEGNFWKVQKKNQNQKEMYQQQFFEQNQFAPRSPYQKNKYCPVCKWLGQQTMRKFQKHVFTQNFVQPPMRFSLCKQHQYAFDPYYDVEQNTDNRQYIQQKMEDVSRTLYYNYIRNTPQKINSYHKIPKKNLSCNIIHNQQNSQNPQHFNFNKVVKLINQDQQQQTESQNITITRGEKQTKSTPIKQSKGKNKNIENISEQDFKDIEKRKQNLLSEKQEQQYSEKQLMPTKYKQQKQNINPFIDHNEAPVKQKTNKKNKIIKTPDKNKLKSKKLQLKKNKSKEQVEKKNKSKSQKSKTKSVKEKKQKEDIIQKATQVIQKTIKDKNISVNKNKKTKSVSKNNKKQEIEKQLKKQKSTEKILTNKKIKSVNNNKNNKLSVKKKSINKKADKLIKEKSLNKDQDKQKIKSISKQQKVQQKPNTPSVVKKQSTNKIIKQEKINADKKMQLIPQIRSTKSKEIVVQQQKEISLHLIQNLNQKVSNEFINLKKEEQDMQINSKYQKINNNSNKTNEKSQNNNKNQSKSISSIKKESFIELETVKINSNNQEIQDDHLKINSYNSPIIARVDSKQFRLEQNIEQPRQSKSIQQQQTRNEQQKKSSEFLLQQDKSNKTQQLINEQEIKQKDHQELFSDQDIKLVKKISSEDSEKNNVQQNNINSVNKTSAHPIASFQSRSNNKQSLKSISNNKKQEEEDQSKRVSNGQQTFNLKSNKQDDTKHQFDNISNQFQEITNDQNQQDKNENNFSSKQQKSGSQTSQNTFKQSPIKQTLEQIQEEVNSWQISQITQNQNNPQWSYQINNSRNVIKSKLKETTNNEWTTFQGPNKENSQLIQEIKQSLPSVPVYPIDQDLYKDHNSNIQNLKNDYKNKREQLQNKIKDKKQNDNSLTAIKKNKERLQKQLEA